MRKASRPSEKLKIFQSLARWRKKHGEIKRRKRRLIPKSASLKRRSAAISPATAASSNNRSKVAGGFSVEVGSDHCVIVGRVPKRHFDFDQAAVPVGADSGATLHKRVIHVRKGLICSAISLILAAAAVPAFAQSAGDWAVGVGVHQVDPKSDSGIDGLDVDANFRPTITGEYFVADNLGIEVLAALPFEHDIDIEGAGTVGSTKQLPPTVSLQYHFNGNGTVSPFIGAGLNYTMFFSEDTRGALEGAKLKLDDSWGLAAHAGLDFAVGEKGAIRVDVRWIDIDAEASVNGAKLGTVEIDPVVYGAAYVFKF